MRIHAHIKRQALPHLAVTDAEREAIIHTHRNSQRLLDPLEVAVPYAELIEYPTAQHRSNRDLKRLVATIKASAFLHQHQRRQVDINGVLFVIATVEDYRVAYDHLKKILADTLADLNPTSRELLDMAKEVMKAKKEEGNREKAYFTRKELGEELRWQRQAVARAIKPLEEAGYFDVEKIKNAYRYRILWEEEEEIGLGGVLTPEELEEKIAAHIDEIGSVYLKGCDV
jgi:biotin operon repressor